MKIIRNSIIPFKGFKAINLFGILFVRGNAEITPQVLNHEEIHTKQMKEMLYIFFYLWYLIEFLVRLVSVWDTHLAYKFISFEVEAYGNELDLDYLNKRKHYAWFKDYLW